MTRSEAIKLRGIVEQAAISLDDRTASEAPALFPRLRGDGSLVAAGTRINWNGVLRQAAVDLWDTPENNPDSAPSLWAELAYRAGIRVIPETISAAQAFAKGEQGWWGDVLYTSLMDGNAYTPRQYAQGWTAAQ